MTGDGYTISGRSVSLAVMPASDSSYRYQAAGSPCAAAQPGRGASLSRRVIGSPVVEATYTPGRSYFCGTARDALYLTSTVYQRQVDLLSYAVRDVSRKDAPCTAFWMFMIPQKAAVRNSQNERNAKAGL